MYSREYDLFLNETPMYPHPNMYKDPKDEYGEEDEYNDEQDDYEY